MTANAKVTSVKVRMYRHGFGDCFLLTFFRDQERVFSMLVDCGIKHNTRSDKVPIEDVIADLKKTLSPAGGGKPFVDVLVATHEHWDHISYFHPTKSPDFFAAFEIGQVWLAWTEDPDDEEAVAINSRLRDGAAALQVAAMRVQKAEADESRQFSGMYITTNVAAARKSFNIAMQDVLGFYGVASSKETSDSGIKYKPNGKISVETEVAMSHIVKLGKRGGGIKYLSPGTIVDRQRLPPGVNVFVLGPPCGKQINKSNPSSGPAHETYLGIDHSGLTSFIDGLLKLGAEPSTKTADAQVGAAPTTTTADVQAPFGNGVGMTEDDAQKDPYYQSTYFAEKEAYRRIEHSWLDVVGQFSLQLDGAINNTSLVLAIELEETGKVLLFPGDAQVGSWLSWHDFEWKVERGDKTATIKAEDLLRNTVLYKVSHHGSHNATVKDKGLELMTHPELVAMMPEKEDSYNGIPYPPLMERLKRLCKGRVLVSADVNFPPEKLIQERPDGLSAAEWNSFKADLIVNRLYVEYTIR